MTSEATKRCAKCGRVKAATEFYPRKECGSKALRSKCKTCESKTSSQPPCEGYTPVFCASCPTPPPCDDWDCAGCHMRDDVCPCWNEHDEDWLRKFAHHEHLLGINHRWWGEFGAGKDYNKGHRCLICGVRVTNGSPHCRWCKGSPKALAKGLVDEAAIKAAQERREAGA